LVQGYSLPRFTLFDSAGSTRLVTPIPCPRISYTVRDRILRPGWTGCFTPGTPVPLQAAHLTSGKTFLDSDFFIKKSFLKK
jgi:hypothetical protein